jgi:hypothetical protein
LSSKGYAAQHEEIQRAGRREAAIGRLVNWSIGTDDEELAGGSEREAKGSGVSIGRLGNWSIGTDDEELAGGSWQLAASGKRREGGCRLVD